MELLIIKNGESYFRVVEGNYLTCSMDKASVFPLEQKEKVMEHIDVLKNKGFPKAAIYKLTITEEPYEADS